MLIRHLEVENFLGHERERISLPEEGLFLLSGESGSGKSSFIVDAVAYALFGAVATRARKQQELINRNHPDKPVVVRVMFEFADAQPLVVARGIDERGASWAKAYEPDPDDPDSSTLLAEGAQPVARYLRRRIGGMTWRQFYAAFVARQSEISLLTTLSGRERKEKIHQMLGMRELEKTEELIAGALRRVRAEVDQLERSLGGVSLAEMRQRLHEAGEEAKQRAERLEGARRRHAAAKRRAEETRQRVEPLRRARADRERRAELEARIAVVREAAERQRKAEEVRRRIPDLKAARDEAQRERELLAEAYQRSREHARAERELAVLEERRSELRAKLLPLVPVAVTAGGEAVAEQAGLDPRALRDEEQRLISTLSSRRERLAEIDEQMRRLADTGECYACLRPFAGEAEHDEALHALRERRSELEAEIARLDARSKELAAARPQLEELEKLDAKVAQVRERREEIAAQGAVEEDLESLTQRGKQAAKRMEDAQRELAAAEARVQEADPEAPQELKRLEDELAGLSQVSFDASELERLEGELAEAERQEAALSGSLPELERSVGEAERVVESAKRELKGREHELEQLERLRSRLLAHERLQAIVRAYKVHLAGEIRPALEEIGSEMLQRVSGGRMRQMKIADDNYEIEVVTSDGYTLPAVMLSGGEEIRANICLRLALTRLVSQRTGVPLGFLILDEPLPAQDPGHVERILELLQSLRPFYRQQFIISHVGNLRHADAIDYVLDFKSPQGAERIELTAA